MNRSALIAEQPRPDALPQRPARWRAWLRPGAMSAPIVILLLVMLVYPVGQLLLLSVHNGTGFTLVEYKRLFASSVYVDVLLITLKVSLWNAILFRAHRISDRVSDFIADAGAQEPPSLLGPAFLLDQLSLCARLLGSCCSGAMA